MRLIRTRDVSLRSAAKKTRSITIQFLEPETGPQWLRTLFVLLSVFLLLSDIQLPKALSFLNRS